MLSQITVSTEVGIGLIIAAGGALATGIGILYRQLVANYEARIAAERKDFDAQLEAMKTERNNWKNVGEEATGKLYSVAARVRDKQGLPRSEVVPDVIAEHSSPATEIQKQTAALATARATLAAATKDLGLPARKEFNQTVDQANSATKANEAAIDEAASSLTNPTAIPTDPTIPVPRTIAADALKAAKAATASASSIGKKEDTTPPETPPAAKQ